MGSLFVSYGIGSGLVLYSIILPPLLPLPGPKNSFSSVTANTVSEWSINHIAFSFPNLEASYKILISVL